MIRVLKLLQADIERVTNVKPDLSIDVIPAGSEVVLIGTLGKSPLIDKLVADKKLEVDDIAGKWETFLIQILEQPFQNVDRALIIVGSDKRGTIFGMFDLAEKIGVSPWYWWADVPPKKKAEIYVLPGRHTLGEPKVKYRGIFINDEAPALSGWAYEKFGGFNSKFYEHVFELILRLKGNFLWPAMWGRAFYDDDPENPRLADEYGVVISTSHHEPMMRAHDEWRRYGSGPWNYEKNEANLKKFWREGIQRMGNYESIVTLAMRGDGDEPMTEEANIELLQRIVKDQREILKEVTGKDVSTIPQVWALYKEVQGYYDRGMRVPDDVTLLLCDDNWGNIRILPKKEDQNHKGGFGIYYHFDYVGGPISYKWLNVTQIEKVWEQMTLAYQWGARKLWLVNVGDIKPMELPISFFLDFAWNPEAIRPDALPQYYVDWAREQFGEKHAKEIGKILSLYTKYNARRHPEMLEPFTYSLVNYREAETITADYNALLKSARAIYEVLPENHRSAFYQLVLYPVEACANLNEMVVTAGKNQLYATQGRASANAHAEQVKTLFARDAELTRCYHDLEGGKWNLMMSQTHIGYTYWNNPPVNKMPAISYVHVPATSTLGYVIENIAGPRFEGSGEPRYSTEMPQFDPVNNQEYYVELFNTGNDPIDYTIKTKQDWIKVSSTIGTIQTEEKVYVSIDWQKAPKGRSTGKIVISGPGNKYTVNVPIRTDLPDCAGFVENNGVVSIEAAHFDRAVNTADIRWITVPNLGRTQSAVTIEPSNADRQTPGKDSPHLEYTFTVFDAVDVEVQTYLSPTLNFMKNEGLKYAIAIDDEPPQVVNMHEGETQPDWEYPRWWNTSVVDHIKIKTTKHKGLTPGKHTLKVWMVDPGVVFQKFVIDEGGLKPSYLGPPESYFHTAIKNADRNL
ncbi:MAG: glycosyl hydrolase 115 family protein [candidate division KSB1 bacterium]|nr:glycosyl hydrolase 115 family protein [candidate division KSB1 bacterium]MDZ7317688.1 glycosyl hydrolase 115 family protein [candidate division KSB1 bacterium]